jgi:regulator of sirC expression with transglutaminase-like and TPR domain
MLPDKEINALLQLVDDPDDEVFETVAAKIIRYGRQIIPKLETVWESTFDKLTQDRMELLIHQVRYNDLQEEVTEWSKNSNPDLLRGAILIAKYEYPDINIPALLAEFDQLRRSVWLELNNYLTPLEQVNVLNTIIYTHYKFTGNELTDRNIGNFFVNKLFDTKQGNSYSIGIVYLAICELLDIPIFAVEVPQQFLFAYIDTLYSFFSNDPNGVQQIQFYIEPTSGMAYTQTDLDNYLKKLKQYEKANKLLPLTNKEIICKLIDQLSNCFQYKNEETKIAELKQLRAVIQGSIK